MRRLKLTELQLTAVEILDRQQLKNVLGGSGSEPCPDNSCGGTMGSCDSGWTCEHLSCDNDQFTYSVCVKNCTDGVDC